MKRIIILISFLTLCFGCTKVLDKGRLDQVTEKSYWNSVTDLELYVNQFYTSLTDTYGGTAFWSYDGNSDNLQPISPSQVLEGTRAIPSSGGGWSWSNIRSINYFFKNENKVSSKVGDRANQYLGEAYFFRALFYFKLVKRFGDVPWYSKVLNIDSKDLMAPRNPRNQIIDSIINDLDKAIGLLSLKNKLPLNRINKGCALLFKSRVCLYEGTWEKYHKGTVFGVKGSNGERYLKWAVEAANELMDKGNFSLYSTGHPDKDYGKLFSSDDLSDNSEVILYIDVDPTLDLGTFSWNYLNGQKGFGSGVTKSLVDSYLCKDGLPISLSNKYKGDTTVQDVVSNRDPRLEQTIWVPGQIEINTDPPIIYKYPPLNGGGAELSTTGYVIRKGSTQDPEQNQGSSTDKKGKIDGIIFRYSEVLLNYTEAKAELGTLTQNDLDKSINLIRARVGLPPLNINVGYIDPNWKFPELSPIINEIRRERRIELALEGFRYDDLMRWAAADLIKGKRWKGARFIQNKSFPGSNYTVQDLPLDSRDYIDRYKNILPNGFGFNENRDYLYPIPTNELTLNKNLKQNPGW